MRKLLVVALLAVFAVIVLMRMSGDSRSTRDSVDGVANTGSVTPGTGRADRTIASDPPKESERAEAPALRRLKLLYQDGTPAARVEVHLASGRSMVTKIFRNGDYPEKRIWLITDVTYAWTGNDGTFTFRKLDSPAVLYTKSDSPAFLLEEFDESATEYRATRRVKLTGTMRDADGKLLKAYTLSAQQGWPEDYDTRNVKEHDSFVGPMGYLEIDPIGKQETTTDTRGRFTLRLLPGRNMLSFGDWRQDGTTNIDVPAGLARDLGDVAVPPPAGVPALARELSGRVLDLSGKPHAHVLVRLWDGVVGEASHETRTNTDGEWAFSGLVGNRVIAWALSPLHEPHVIVPAQSSGTIHMPNNTSVTLRAPSAEEYCWMRAPAVGGFFLFIRDGVFLGGDSLFPNEAVGLPPGDYRVVVMSNDGIRETTRTADKGGTLELREFTRN